MAPEPFQSQATVSFLGSRWRMFAILLFGYILSLLTLGIYRFWMVTRKRRFYWSNTLIDGEALEYTGTSLQLLVGFLIALGIFLPLYGFFFYLSTQTQDTAIYGYTAAAAFMYFLSGYAAYRARRFLLTRTLWRGARFSLSGSAWSYAFMRFFWTLLTGVTLGLAYPFMTASLWRYRYANTWFGDRQCHFAGSWKTIARVFYFNYFLILGLVIGALYFLDKNTIPNSVGRNQAAIIIIASASSVVSIIYFYLRSRIISRMLSSVSIGKAKLKVHVRARSLIWQQISYAVLVGIIAIGFFIIVAFAMGDSFEPFIKNQKAELSEILK